jgi:hypothetical protein
MSKEKLPEPSGWKERLSDPQELSAWGLSDKEGAWDKLHARLGKRPHRKGGAWLIALGISGRGAWYWAAACILAVLGLALLFREGTSGPSRETANMNAGQSAQKGKARNDVAARTASAIRPGPRAGDPGQISGASMTEQEQVIRVATPREGFKTPARKKGRVQLPVTATIVAEANNGANDKILGLTHPIERLPDSSRWIAGREPAPAKRMRVVHINELDRPMGSSPSLASNSSSLRWLKWGRSHASDTGLYSAQEDPVRPVHPIITIHLSPQN